MKKHYVVLIVFLGIALLLVFGNNLAPIRFVTGVTQSIFSYPKALLYGAKTELPAGDSKEIEKLKKENQKLTKKFVDYNNILRDNEALRSQFETAETSSFTLLPAKIVGFVGKFTTPSSLIINQGENSKIKVGMAVILDNNLVGKIAAVEKNYSEVMLPVSSRFSTLATTSENSALGVVKGQNDFILLDNVPIRDKMVNGEVVLTKGDINDDKIGIPQGIIIGKISSVNNSPSLPFQTAKVESLVDFAKLNMVFVVMSF